MTKQSAIEKIKYFPNWNLDDQWLLEEEMQELSDMAISALEKQIPYKPKPCMSYAGKCVCGAVFLDRFTKHCGNCGQLLDWSDCY